MKLIIDVDEKLVCEGFIRTLTEEERDILIKSIGNGTPYEERPKGKWIDNGPSGYYGIRDWCCSSCKFRWITSKKESLDPDWRYCPYCGADMRGDE